MLYYIWCVNPEGKMALITPQPYGRHEAVEALRFAAWYSRTYKCMVHILDKAFL